LGTCLSDQKKLQGVMIVLYQRAKCDGERSQKSTPNMSNRLGLHYFSGCIPNHKR